MPRIIEEQLEGYRFGVSFVEVPELDEQGNQIFHNGDGGPRMAQQVRLQFVEQNPLTVHVIKIPLTLDARDELVRLLTGGVLVASQVPKGPIVL